MDWPGVLRADAGVLFKLPGDPFFIGPEHGVLNSWGVFLGCGVPFPWAPSLRSIDGVDTFFSGDPLPSFFGVTLDAMADCKQGCMAS